MATEPKRFPDDGSRRVREALSVLILIIAVMIIILFATVFPELHAYLESWLKSHTTTN